MRSYPASIDALLSLLALGGACADDPRSLRAQTPAAGSGASRPGGHRVDEPTVPASDSARQISEYIVEMYQDRAGNLWFGTISDGVCRHDGDSFVCFTEREGFSGGSVRGIVEDDAGSIWFATDGGVYRHDGTSFTTYTVADGLSDNKVLSAAKDRHGTLWFGTDGGVCRHDGTTFSSFALPLATSVTDFPTGNRSPWLVWSIREDRSGNLWFGTNGSGVIRHDGEVFTRFTTREGLANDFVFSILEDRRGNLWFGTNGGLSRHDGAAFTTYTTSDGLGSHDVWAMIEDRSGNLWLGTGGGGATRFDGTSFMTVSEKDGLGNGHVQSLLEDRSGRLWIGTSGGAYQFDGQRAVHITRGWRGDRSELRVQSPAGGTAP